MGKVGKVKAPPAPHKPKAASVVPKIDNIGAFGVQIDPKADPMAMVKVNDLMRKIFDDNKESVRNKRQLVLYQTHHLYKQISCYII